MEAHKLDIAIAFSFSLECVSCALYVSYVHGYGPMVPRP